MSWSVSILTNQSSASLVSSVLTNRNILPSLTHGQYSHARIYLNPGNPTPVYTWDEGTSGIIMVEYKEAVYDVYRKSVPH